MTIRYTFYCGTDTNGHDVDGRQLAYDLAADFFPAGHSTREEQGRWQGEVGTVDELTVVVTWLTDDMNHHATASNFAAAYKDMAWQESVMVLKETVDAAFV